MTRNHSNQNTSFWLKLSVMFMITVSVSISVKINVDVPVRQNTEPFASDERERTDLPIKLGEKTITLETK